MGDGWYFGVVVSGGRYFLDGGGSWWLVTFLIEIAIV